MATTKKPPKPKAPKKPRIIRKTWVIQKIFDQLWLTNEGRLSRTTVVMDDVREAILAHNATQVGVKKLSSDNPPNFLKDIGRRWEGANNTWPKPVFDLGFTGRQSIGDDKAVFEFMPVLPGQLLPFPEPFVTPSDITPNTIDVESLSITLAVKSLGRADESFLVQALVNVRAIESHFAMTSKHKGEIVQVDFLQTNVKLGKGEADALFLLTRKKKGQPIDHLVATCEVKGKKEVAWPDQIRRQAVAFLKSPQGKSYAEVLPLYVKAIGEGTVRIVELGIIKRDDIPNLQDSDLKIAAESRVRLVPTIPGLG